MKSADYTRRVITTLTLVLSCGATADVNAQFLDDFSDGDFDANPTWNGQTSAWIVSAFEADFALQLDGPAASDTAFLATPNQIAYGTWKFRFNYSGGQLSNFNQVRVFLTASSQDLTAPLTGYHLQLGTNDRNVRLYRSDPTVSGGRALLESSADDVIAAESDTVDVVVTRSTDNTWVVSLDDSQVLSVTESTSIITESQFFGVWAKHSASRNQHVLFDDFDVSNQMPADETPPTIAAASYIDATRTVVVRFSEPIDPTGISESSFVIDNGVGMPTSVTISDSDISGPNSVAELVFSDVIPTGTYNLTASGIRDVAGNTASPLTTSLDVVSDTQPPSLQSVAVTDNRHLVVTFSELVDTNSACDADHYDVTPVVGQPDRVECPSNPSSSIEIEFDDVIPGGSYQLVVTNVADLSGNVLVTASLPFSVAIVSDVPNAGDLVINEISYDPAEPNLEYVELLNVTDKTFDLSEFEFSDDRLSRVTVSSAAHSIAPHSFAVLVRDANLFAAAFPDVSFVVPPSWPALNNTGDAVVLFHGTVTIDSVSFDPSWGGADRSLERKDPSGPSGIAANWGSSTDASGGTPGRTNSIFGPDLTPPSVLFAEQSSATTIWVYFDEPVAIATITPSNFLLGSTQPSSARLLADETTVELELNQVQDEQLTVSGVTDVVGNVIQTTTVDVAQIPDAGELRLSEILYDPRADESDGLPDQTEFVELFNASNKLLSVSRLYWTDRPNENNEADTLRFGSGGVLEPGAFAVVFAQSTDILADEVYSNSDLVLAFPNDYRGLGARLIPVNASSLGLTNSGALIRLHRADDDMLVDDIVLDEVEYSPSWHHPNLRETKGISLERIDPDGQANNRSNWSSSVSAEGATPGAENSINLSFPDNESAGRLQVEPSPFSPDHDGTDDFTSIRFELKSGQPSVRIRVFDSRGRLVRDLERGLLTSSTGAVTWNGLDNDGNELPIGVYIVLLDAVDSQAGTTETYKEVVVLARQLN